MEYELHYICDFFFLDFQFMASTLDESFLLSD